MSHQTIRTLIAEARSATTGEFTSTSRVVDQLLDLRSLAAADSDLLRLVDRTLADLPGRSVVPTSWWLESLDAIDVFVANQNQGQDLHPTPG